MTSAVAATGRTDKPRLLQYNAAVGLRAHRRLLPDYVMKLQAMLRRMCWTQVLSVMPLIAQTPPDLAPDSAFLLTAADPARRPSPFIGNGHLGLVVPPLGIGADANTFSNFGSKPTRRLGCGPDSTTQMRSLSSTAIAYGSD